MKTKMMLMIIGSVLVSGACVLAQEAQDVGRVVDAKQAAADVAAKKAVEVGNKICPVSNEEVGTGEMGEIVKYEYNGKIYNLCCPMCEKSFKKDPAKYSKIAEDEVLASAK